jgi:Holliday junction DNA helicase RuvB
LAGPRITSTIVEKLRAVKFADFVFVDEAHALDRESQELLNIAIDERRTLGCREDGKLDRGQSVSIAEFTLVAATTEPGKMTKALRSRLNEITLDPYGLGELKAIAEKAAKELKLTVTPQAAKHLAERSQRTPRSVEKLLKLLAVTKSGVAKVDQQLVRGFLEELGIDEHGLDRSQQSHLKILFAAGTRPTSLAILKARLGLDADYILSDIEPHLLFLELIDIGLRGRTLTERGRGVAHEIVRATEAVESCDESDSVSNEEAR